MIFLRVKLSCASDFCFERLKRPSRAEPKALASVAEQLVHAGRQARDGALGQGADVLDTVLRGSVILTRSYSREVGIRVPFFCGLL